MTITNEEPKINKNRKYFFGYYDWCGRLYACKWVEDDGLVVGGIPTPIVQKHEISLEDYDNTILVILESRYPVEVDARHLVVKPGETDLT